MNVEHFEYNGESYPYKIGYKVFKQFQEQKKKSADELATMNMEDMVYLHFLGFKAGAAAKEEPCKFATFGAFEDFIDQDFNLITKLEKVFLKFLPDPLEEGK